MQRNMIDVESFLSNLHYGASPDSPQAYVLAIWSKLMMIGEAARRVSRALERGIIPAPVSENLTTVDLLELIDKRNRMIHNYWDVDQESILKAVNTFRAEVAKIDDSLYQEYLQSTSAPGDGDE